MTDQTKQRINGLSQAMRNASAPGRNAGQEIWTINANALLKEFASWEPLSTDLEESADALGELASTSLLIDDMRDRVTAEIARHVMLLQNLRTLQNTVNENAQAFDEQTTRLVPEELVGTYMVGTWPIRLVIDNAGNKVFRKIQAEPLEHTG